MPYTQIVFVGHHKEKILESIKALHKYPSQKIILMVGKQVSSGENKAKRIANEIKKALKPIWEVHEKKVDKKNILNATNQLLDLILKERRAGSDVLINATGSLRTFAIAAYIAGCFTNSRVITSIPRYDESDIEVGIEEILELPLIPINFPTEEQKKILLGIQEEAESLKNLIIQLSSHGKQGKKELQKERSRISHHLTNMEELMLIKRNKQGKNVWVTLTFLGKLMVKIFNSSNSKESLSSK